MVMGKKSSKADGARCRRHPRHRQGPGVCAFCLRESLSHLSLSASLPSVVRGCGEEERYEEGASSCSEVSTAYSSQGSSGASSECASPAAPEFHDEIMRHADRVSLLTRDERVIGDADAVAVFLQARREEKRRTATSFWAKLLHATRGGGKKQERCSLAHSKTLEERAASAKWVLF
ncbi:uncharacterized protein LOC133921188 [Phragmites australis]|uniref:uncharacterized protein LOC133921188 n=1 Tax=Phragmites australis TaxID=29695 RepID=UPI002D78FE48|nr:uncharacterized protein LOC133921188 [Phragmites australis]